MSEPRIHQSELPLGEIIVGDAASVLRRLPSASFETVITSPPYFLLRNYGVKGQLGAESTVEEYVDNLVEVCDQIGRILTATGSFWLDLGDSYSRHERFGAPPKSMLLVPERVLLALSARGWIVRNKVVFAKSNPMPSSVKDRLSCAWEPLFHLVRSARYLYDLDAIREPHKTRRRGLTATRTCKRTVVGTSKIRASITPSNKPPSWAGPFAGSNEGLARARREGHAGHARGRNPRDVWVISNNGFRGHHAVFPPRLIERPMLATCPERVCTSCTRPWQRTNKRLHTDCECGVGWRRGRVLDPFMGSGTSAVVAKQLGRDWLGIELNPTYRSLANSRIASTETVPESGIKSEEVMPL